MRHWQITFGCTLLEDMHCGSGLGWLGLVDNTHARDARGRAVVWFSTLAGLLRDQADQWAEVHGKLKPSGSDSPHSLSAQNEESYGQLTQRLHSLFGYEGTARSRLAVRSLHFVQQADALDRDLSPFLAITRTAREVHSRRPMDQTMRTIEMAAGGQTAQGEIRLLGDEEDCELVRQCLRRLSVIGTGKSRGMGRVKITLNTDKEVTFPTGTFTKPSSLHLRLLLKSLEPLCLAKTAFPGNLIASLSYIPGQALRGAFFAAMNERLDKPIEWSDKGIRFGNSYFVPRELLKLHEGQYLLDWNHLESIPLPLSAEERKPTEVGYANPDIPWWAQHETDSPSTQKGQDGERRWVRDVLRTDDPVKEGQRYKRIKSEDYLVTAEGQRFYRVRPEMRTLMRNQVPATRTSRSLDSRREDMTNTDYEAALFAETVLGEDQCFVADVYFEGEADAECFAKHAAAFLEQPEETRHWLRVGRGGRPVIVAAHYWVGSSMNGRTPSSQTGATTQSAAVSDAIGKGDNDEFTLTLTSDLIARSPDLGFERTLTATALVRLLDESADMASKVEISDGSRSETTVVHGFNTAAGNRRAAALAVRRGSCFLIKSDKKTCNTLVSKLMSLTAAGKGLGERQDEGFGRFVLQHPWHTQHGNNLGHLAVNPLPREPNPVERVLETVEAPLRTLLKKLADGPSRSQWQSFVHDIEATRNQQDIDTCLNRIVEHGNTLGGRAWAGIAHNLETARSQHGEWQSQRLFLSNLGRRMVIEINHRQRRSPEREASR